MVIWIIVIVFYCVIIGHGVVISQEGLYEIVDDTLYMGYKDFLIDWKDNTMFVQFKLDGDTLFILSHKFIKHTDPRNLGDCKTYSDTIHVIDKYFYNKNGNKKPPCSSSPDYCGCMKARGFEI